MPVRDRQNNRSKRAVKNNNNADQTTVDAVVENKSQPAPQSQNRPKMQGVGWTESSSDWIAPPANTRSARAPRTAALMAQDISVIYGVQKALDGITFTLYQGDTLGLLGLNGAGKSTLLKVLSGAMAPARGTVQIGEHELYENTVAPRMKIGYAPDKPAVYPEFKVNEFLHFIARMRRIDRRAIKNSVDQVIERCALGDVRNRIIGNLSTGFQQRVNIAQALIHSPKVLILDEPSNGLDPVQLMEIRELVATLASDQATVFSSHLLSEVNSICNQVILIDKGRQILDAPLKLLSDERNNSYALRLLDDANFNLQDLPGVTHACKTKAGHWLVTGNALAPDHLQAMLKSRDLQATQITASENYLESLFKQLATTAQTNSSHLTKDATR